VSIASFQMSSEKKDRGRFEIEEEVERDGEEAM
jgi:hypothetical protein